MSTREVILDVQGMSCGSCVRHVERALRATPGVVAVEVALRDGRVRASVDGEHATDADLVDALGEAGYPARPHGAER